MTARCNCPYHIRSEEERGRRIDAAIEEVNAEVQANGGSLERFLDDLEIEFVERIRKDLEGEL